MGLDPFLYLCFSRRLFSVLQSMKIYKITLTICVLSIFLGGILLFSDVGFSQTIIAFGDSLTEGCEVSILGCDGWDDGDYNYPVYLETFVNANGPDSTVKNFGKGGETTSEGVNRLDTVLNSSCNLKVDYVLLLQGTNDLFHHEDPSVIRFNLGVMIDKVRAKGIEPVLATITPDWDNPWKELDKANEYIRSLASEKGVVLADQYNALAPYWYWYTNPRGCYGDQLHPNSKGFYAMAVVWFEAIPKPPVSFPWLMLLLDTP